MMSLGQLRVEAARELTENILTFHMAQGRDKQYGGFYGRIDSDNQIHPQAPKGLVQHSRLLWSYARAYRQFKAAAYREMAERAFGYLQAYFWDEAAGGLYWLVDFAGRPLVTDKYIYGQSFAIYGFSEYYLATEDERSLETAVALFHLLEGAAGDKEYGGYFEVFQQDWQARLAKNVDSAEGPVEKTMNSHLHLLEAYTSLLKAETRSSGAYANLLKAETKSSGAYTKLWKAWPDPEMRGRLLALVRLHLERIIDPASYHLRLHFAADWTPLNEQISYGHDIEASWLLVEAAEALGEAELVAESQNAALRIAERVYNEGLDGDGGLLSGPGETVKEWWPQAEALVGFLNAYQLSQQPQYLEAVHSLWAYVQDAFVDHQNGEWFAGRQADGALLDEEKAGVWKTPYHNGRACLELMQRLDTLEK